MYARVSHNLLLEVNHAGGKRAHQISAPTPCWGNPSSTVTSLLVFLTEALIVDLSSGLIDRRLITCFKRDSNWVQQEKDWTIWNYKLFFMPASIYLSTYSFLCKYLSRLKTKQRSFRYMIRKTCLEQLYYFQKETFQRNQEELPLLQTLSERPTIFEKAVMVTSFPSLSIC